jgi:acetyltransferase-like isoleucine patch superfamily enzyme
VKRAAEAWDGAAISMTRKNIFRRITNRLFGMLARLVPGATSFRPFLHRLRGVDVRGRVFIGDDVYLENEYPENVRLEDGAQICLRSIVLAHSHGLGYVVVERDSFVGAGCLLLATPGRTLRIGAGAVITAGSVITSDVPPGVLYGNDKPKVLARANVPLGIETPFEDFLAGLRPHGKELTPTK